MLQAIIFDMDGVIVDTEYVEFTLQKQFIADIQEHNRPITPEQQSEVVGKSLREIPEIVKKLSGSHLSLAAIQTRYQAFFNDLFSNVDYRTIFRSDIKQIIEFAKAHRIKLAVASSSALSHISNILTECGIKDDFDLIVTGDDFDRSKPDPAIYRHTLDSLGVSAEHAVAVEDSYYGMLAAKGAGVTVIGYEEKRMIVDQSLADYMGKDMTEILALIKWLHAA
ncbi:HAD-IA family hydrolase [Bisgaard Taxon 10/6]|uniref:HAD-IA family hydrolase n=1 Tax=Exercitatus varius TaxID=67857 RepID=A0ABT6END9_9PAST|nr:HAD-IA family hydrolase [Exercitatus varius]MDG2939380.1 HAD-IA family hydrolase [Exercitatus varius]MDG2945054.1 HAD-IA family hydrolase [Exercitatus varius]